MKRILDAFRSFFEAPRSRKASLEKAERDLAEARQQLDETCEMFAEIAKREAQIHLHQADHPNLSMEESLTHVDPTSPTATFDDA